MKLPAYKQSLKPLTYKQLAEFINELPPEQKEDTATFVLDGEAYAVHEFLAASELPDDIQNDVMDALYDEHFVMLHAPE